MTGSGYTAGVGTAEVYTQTYDGKWIQLAFKGAALQPECPVNLVSLDAFHFARGVPTQHEVDFKRETVWLGKPLHAQLPLPRDNHLRLHFMDFLSPAAFSQLNIPSHLIHQCCF